jgi:hypothetical protein
MKDTSEIEFRSFIIQLGCDIFVAVPKEFRTQQEAHAYIITGYDKLEEDSKLWYFIKTGKIINSTDIKPWTVKKFNPQNLKNGFFPAMQFGQIEYCVWMLEIEFAKQIAKFIPTLPKGNVHVFTTYLRGDIFDLIGVKAYNR